VTLQGGAVPHPHEAKASYYRDPGASAPCGPAWGCVGGAPSAAVPALSSVIDIAGVTF